MDEKDLTPLQRIATESPGDFLAGVQSAFGKAVIDHIQLHTREAMAALLACDLLNEKQLDLAKTLKFKYESFNQLIEEFRDAMVLATDKLNEGDKKEIPKEEEVFDAYGYG